jgi:hypothetical protein
LDENANNLPPRPAPKGLRDLTYPIRVGSEGSRQSNFGREYPTEVARYVTETDNLGGTDNSASVFQFPVDFFEIEPACQSPLVVPQRNSKATGVASSSATVKPRFGIHLSPAKAAILNVYRLLFIFGKAAYSPGMLL